MEPKNWTCPYCGHAQVVTERTFDETVFCINNDLSKFGQLAGKVVSIVCSNIDCKELSLWFALHKRGDMHFGEWNISSNAHHFWSLLPESNAKPQPQFIPQPIVDNYKQACRIRDQSANASAAMARRCLQGMIRDFCNVSKGTLAKEIETLKSQVNEGKGPPGVSPDTLVAIDHIREIGNIGAHMEKDINLILDVEPDEAQALIDLIELLFEEWYVARQAREEKLKKLRVVANKKIAKKVQARLSSPAEK